jgi:hypothetical protein
MELKFPKKITILGYPFKITYSKTHGGGAFNFSTLSLEIGTEFIEIDPIQTLLTINHELMEMILEGMYLRYTEGDAAAGWRFSFTHKEFCTAMAIFTEKQKEFIK